MSKGKVIDCEKSLSQDPRGHMWSQWMQQLSSQFNTTPCLVHNFTVALQRKDLEGYCGLQLCTWDMTCQDISAQTCEKKISINTLVNAHSPVICLYTHTHFPQICSMHDLNESTGFLSGNADKQNMEMCMSGCVDKY